MPEVAVTASFWSTVQVAVSHGGSFCDGDFIGVFDQLPDRFFCL